MSRFARLFGFLAVASAPLLLACSPSGPQVGSQTNWLQSCDGTQECGGLECICGVCTLPCAAEACGEFPESACITSTESGAIAVCGGEAPPSGLCLPRCTEDSCPQGASCIAGVCAPSGNPTARVTLDLTSRHQTLVGFGASLAYADDAIVAHPHKEALYDLLFESSGFDTLRLRNRYEDANEDDLLPAVEIIDAARQRLGYEPFLFMTSATPPASLKANASRTCGGDDATCTLVTTAEGGFDYPGFANYWRSSLEAYANAGIVLDYFSIQNHPNLVPDPEFRGDACRFLPEEGTTSITIDDVPTDVDYPGYREAVDAVLSSIEDLPDAPPMAVAESTGVVSVGEYVPPLEASSFEAIAFHLYGVDPTAPNIEAFENIRALSEELGVPVLQTEIQAEGFETAVLAHHALATAGASTFMQNDFVTSSRDGDPLALVLMTDEGIEPLDPFYALTHYARTTDPGWVRVDAGSDSSELLSSAWLSSDESALTIVFVNSGPEGVRVDLAEVDALREQFPRSEVTRTVFDGLERYVSLGALASSGVVHVPSRSIATIQLTGE